MNLKIFDISAEEAIGLLTIVTRQKILLEDTIQPLRSENAVLAIENHRLKTQLAHWKRRARMKAR